MLFDDTHSHTYWGLGKHLGADVFFSGAQIRELIAQDSFVL